MFGTVAEAFFQTTSLYTIQSHRILRPVSFAASPV
jgi:hypothetical protein